MSDAIYARVSGAGQKRDKTVEAQLHDGRRWAQGQGITPTEYVDEGVSGYALPLAERPAGREPMLAARGGRLARLWLWNVDRHGRNAVETLNALQDLNRVGVQVFENGRPILTGSATSNLQGGIKAAIAQYARDRFLANPTVLRPLDRTRIGYALEEVRP